MDDRRISAEEARRREVLADASCEVVCYQHAADVPVLLRDISMDGEGLHAEVGQCPVCAADLAAANLRADEAEALAVALREALVPLARFGAIESIHRAPRGASIASHDDNRPGHSDTRIFATDAIRASAALAIPASDALARIRGEAWADALAWASEVANVTADSYRRDGADGAAGLIAAMADVISARAATMRADR